MGSISSRPCRCTMKKVMITLRTVQYVFIHSSVGRTGARITSIARKVRTNR